jgi:hypothetical protein
MEPVSSVSLGVSWARRVWRVRWYGGKLGPRIRSTRADAADGCQPGARRLDPQIGAAPRRLPRSARTSQRIGVHGDLYHLPPPLAESTFTVRRWGFLHLDFTFSPVDSKGCAMAARNNSIPDNRYE